MPPKLDRLRQIVEIFRKHEGYAKYADVARLFAALAPILKGIEPKLAKKLSTSLKNLEGKMLDRVAFASGAPLREIKATRDDVSREMGALREQIAASFTEPELLLILDAFKEELDLAKPTPEETRDTLETLAGDERLDISAIKGWEEFERRIVARASASAGATVVAAQRGAVRDYDISASLDGIKTTFALPAFSRVLMVQSTSFPTAFRPGIDYTTDSNAMTITFTNQIDPATTLAAGQSIILLYAEN